MMESPPPFSETNADPSRSAAAQNDQDSTATQLTAQTSSHPTAEPPSTSTDGHASVTSQPESPSIRYSVGNAMYSVSDVVNNNLIAVRFGVTSSVILLGAYGISNTPLFFRFRTIHEIPSSYFVRRKRLYGRIVEVDTSSSLSCPDGSIHLYVRHLSPVGQILPKTWIDFFQKMNSTAVAVTASNDAERKRDMIKVTIAGVQYPPFSHLRYKTEEYLERLARDGTLVSCQLLARQVPKTESSNIDGRLPPRSKRSMEDAFPELRAELSEKGKERQQYYDDDDTPSFIVDEDTMEEHVGICKLSYRPTFFQLFPTDIAVSLLVSGNASVSSTLLASNQETSDVNSATEGTRTTIVDSSKRLDDLRNDVKYLERLTKAEYDALENEAGIWAFAEARETKSDVVAEIEFQANAGILQKLWRRLRGG